jgi:hypothetical protein
MSDEYSYKRQVDLWIKMSVLITPLLSAAASYGVIKTTITNIDHRLSKVENWIENQTLSMIASAKAAGESAGEQKEMNRRLERIEVILDSRLKRP